MLFMLFPPSFVMTMVAIVFRDMEHAYKVFAEGQSKAEKLPRFVKEREEETRECIKSFLGDYLRVCKDCKYDILEAFMKGVVFEKKRLRESFLQEILKEHVDSGMRASIETYLVEKSFSFDIGDRERIVSMT